MGLIESYARSLGKRPLVDVSISLPDHYYDNKRTLDFSRPDIGHHQLYKTICHFGSITNIRAKRKAQEFLLSNDRIPIKQILRT